MSAKQLSEMNHDERTAEIRRRHDKIKNDWKIHRDDMKYSKEFVALLREIEMLKKIRER